MQMSHAPARNLFPQSTAAAPKSGAILRRQCACGTHAPGGGTCSSCAGDADTMRKRGASAVPQSVHQVLAQPGQALDGETRAFMERGFGRDFSDVRVHDGAGAARSAQDVHARAYTVGRDIVFRSGEYRPRTDTGRHLLAHELAHVVQQRSGAKSDAAVSEIGDAGAAEERQADAAADAVMRANAPGPLADAGRKVQRTPEHPDAGAPPPSPAAPADQIPACGGLDLFTELAMPFYLSNSYFHGGTPIAKDEWNKQKRLSGSGKCNSEGSFSGVKLKWDLGNPKLGTKIGQNLNKNDIKFDINVFAVNTAKPCCPCLTGTVSWSIDVNMKHGAETGKTAKPITGSKVGDSCDGKKCCSVVQDIPIGLTVADGDLTIDFTGNVKLDAATFKK